MMIAFLHMNKYLNAVYTMGQEANFNNVARNWKLNEECNVALFN